MNDQNKCKLISIAEACNYITKYSSLILSFSRYVARSNYCYNSRNIYSYQLYTALSSSCVFKETNIQVNRPFIYFIHPLSRRARVSNYIPQNNNKIETMENIQTEEAQEMT